MTAFHEFDVALGVNTPVAFTAARTPANEVHINAWLAGTKSSPIMTVGSFGNVGSVGLTMSPARAGVAMVNAPNELILSDLSGALVNNLAEWGATVAVVGFNLGGIYFF